MSAKWLRSGVGRWIQKTVRRRGGSSTSSSPEELQQSLLKNLECPVCMEYMTPPINLCHNGHNICNNCRPNLQTCPTCRQEILLARNYALEDLCLKLNYPCKFHEDGCKEHFTGLLIKEHQAVCNYGSHNCPVDKIPGLDCAWRGPFKELVTHIEKEHAGLVCLEAKFKSPERSSSALMLLKYGEIFLYCKCFRDGKCYFLVQMFGTCVEASKFKYKIKLTSENQIEKISMVSLVHSITEDFDTLFRTGRCPRIDEELANQFVMNDILELLVEVSHAKLEELVDEPKCRMRRTDYFRPDFSNRTFLSWCTF
ncbi:hypothetical protein C0J52_24140 [Blattella germanica]|nr:hypothetical protein C0J52_24140 [Blattella germanica]